MAKYIGVLTAGGDSPGLNAALRALGKSAQISFSMQLVGFKDGFRGLMENRSVDLDLNELSGILTMGGTILGTSRDKPYSMPVGNKTRDMTDVIVSNYQKHNLDVLVCIGGGGTHKSAYHLMQNGVNVVTLPKTIDNDIPLTDISLGFDTALGIASEAIDRLHSTAHSHHRIIVVEIMGHNVGWLTLGSGLAGGADVILIPEIPYEIESVVEAIRQRRRRGKNFSIVVVAEGAVSKNDAAQFEAGQSATKSKKARDKENGKLTNIKVNGQAQKLMGLRSGNTLHLARRLEELTGLESRVTILGHLQRGGTPSSADRILAARLGTACAHLIKKSRYGCMVAARGDATTPVELQKVVGKTKFVPLDHPWLQSARLLGINLGD